MDQVTVFIVISTWGSQIADLQWGQLLNVSSTSVVIA